MTTSSANKIRPVDARDLQTSLAVKRENKRYDTFRGAIGSDRIGQLSSRLAVCVRVCLFGPNEVSKYEVSADGKADLKGEPRQILF